MLTPTERVRGMMVRLLEIENARSPDSDSTLPEPDRALIAEGLAQGLEGLDLLLWGYERNFDPTLLAENLKLTPDERVRKAIATLRFVEELRRAGNAFRGAP